MDVPVLRKTAPDFRGADVAVLMEVRESAIVTLGMLLQTLWGQSILWAGGATEHDSIIGPWMGWDSALTSI